MHSATHRILAVGVVVGLAMSILVAAGPPASAEPLGTVVNVNSGRCLGVNYSSHADGTWANQWDCIGAASQSWTVQKVTGNQYRIINANSGRCLGVIGGPGATNPGAHVEQWQCVSSAYTNQLWLFINLGGNYYQIRAVHSGMCMGVDYSYTGNIVANVSPPGYGINQWPCLTGSAPGGAHPAQTWLVSSLPTGCRPRLRFQRRPDGR